MTVLYMCPLHVLPVCFQKILMPGIWTGRQDGGGGGGVDGHTAGNYWCKKGEKKLFLPSQLQGRKFLLLWKWISLQL